jgi:hypothetical protein
VLDLAERVDARNAVVLGEHGVKWGACDLEPLLAGQRPSHAAAAIRRAVGLHVDDRVDVEGVGW